MADYENKNWQCPHCNRDCVVVEHKNSLIIWAQHYGDNYRRDGDYGLITFAIVCPNTSCNQLSLHVSLECFDSEALELGSGYGWEAVNKWSLLPVSMAKSFPDYIPEPIRKDYTEACRIKDISPNASATLARRCLQGMVRDFHDVERSTLKKEFDEIKDKITPDIWKAIDQVRKIGAIGAHMEADVNIMVDVVPDEADNLIWLIEFLFKKWYVDTHETAEQLKELQGMSAKKDTKKQEASAAKKGEADE